MIFEFPKKVTRAASIVRPAEHASRHELIWPEDIYDRLHAAVERVPPAARVERSDWRAIG